MQEDWIARLRALAQEGLTNSSDRYSIERYRQIRALADEIAAHTGHHATLPLRYDHMPQTPKAGIRGAVMHEGKILLVKERDDGLWSMPGGFADVGDTPAQAIEREIREESGYQASARRIFYCHREVTPNNTSFHVLYFLCELVGGVAQTSIETSAVRFFAEDALPPLSVMRKADRMVAQAFYYHQRPHLPAKIE